jgi:hypothetical protein
MIAGSRHFLLEPDSKTIVAAAGASETDPRSIS